MNLEKEIFDISLQDIIPNRFQPREIFNDNDLYELSESIKKHGVIQPIIVRKVGDKYEIIAGERRFRASQLAGNETIPALVRDIDDKEAAKIALLENLQRSNLTPIEEAKTYQTILKIDNITQDELATTLGKSQSTIANKLRLLTLNEEVQTALLNSQISERHARSLIGLTNTQQIELLHRIINEKLTVRQLDEEIMKINGKLSENEIGEGIISKGEISMDNEMTNQELNINPQSSVLNTTIPGVTSVEQPQQNQTLNVNMQEANPSIESPVVTEQKPEMPNIETPVINMPEAPAVPAVETGTFEQAPTVEVPNMEMPVLEEQMSEKPAVNIPEMQPAAPVGLQTESIQQPVAQPEIPVVENKEQNSVPNIPEMQPVEPIGLQTESIQQPVAQPEIPVVENKEQNSVPNIPEMQPVEPIGLQTESIQQPVAQSEMQPVVNQETSQNTMTEPNIFDKLRINREDIQNENKFELKNPDLSAVISESQTKDKDIYDLRFAINNFRQAIQNTEKFGFNVTSNEIDNGNKYQIVIEIEKK